MVNALFILGSRPYEQIYGPDEHQLIQKYAKFLAPPQTPASIRENMDLLAKVEVIFSGWDGPKMDESFLHHAPNLQAVFYGAGSVRSIATEAFWERNIVLTSSYAANGEPVAEYTLSQILFSLKSGWSFMQRAKRQNYAKQDMAVPGAYGSTVGIISLGMIGRRVCELLQAFDVDIVAYDPFVKESDLDEWQVELCSLADVFRRSHVVSLHTPWLKETENMIRGEHFSLMKKHATFINTARGAIVRESEMIDVLQRRPDLYALLDVTWPEPPKHDSPLYTLPNVVLTPHIAGSMGPECRRMGRYAAEEFERYMLGQPLKWQITKEKAQFLA